MCLIPFSLQALDVTEEQSIVSFGKTISAYAPIDLLVNNAGTAYGGFIEDVPMEHFRQQFETNVFGVIHVTKTVLPYIRKHGGAKIINVSSISGLTGFPALSPYVSSKHALEGFSESLRIEPASVRYRNRFDRAGLIQDIDLVNVIIKFYVGAC